MMFDMMSQPFMAAAPHHNAARRSQHQQQFATEPTVALMHASDVMSLLRNAVSSQQQQQPFQSMPMVANIAAPNRNGQHTREDHRKEKNSSRGGGNSGKGNGGKGSGGGRGHGSRDDIIVISAADLPEVLSRTVHLRFLPVTMKQSELAALCHDCGPYNRVRICGGQNNNQNWIYGFVEFATATAATKMMKKSGMELNNGPNKPPLRLKCHSAREPIVDRVFHDADPNKGVACQFGHGAFANRTLKEALDSYFNLVNKGGSAVQLKDAVQQQQQSLASYEAAAAAVASQDAVGEAAMHTPPPSPPQPKTLITGPMLSPQSIIGPMLSPQLPCITSERPLSSELKPSSMFHSLTGSPQHHFLPPATQHTTLNIATQSEPTTPQSSKDHAMAKVQLAHNALSQSMKHGASFVMSQSPSDFKEAMRCAHSALDLVNSLSPQMRAVSPPAMLSSTTGNGSATSSCPMDRLDLCSDPLTNAIREVTIISHFIVLALHITEGSLHAIVPSVNKVMEACGRVPMEPLQRPARFAVGDEEDDDAFLHAITAVHVSQPSAVMSQSLYETAVRHQSFVCNALMSLGFAVEHLNSLIARCAYTTARRRAHVTIDSVSQPLERALRRGGVHTLRFEMLPAQFFATATQQEHSSSASASNESAEDTTFASCFFLSFDEKKKQMPIEHCTSVF